MENSAITLSSLINSKDSFFLKVPDASFYNSKNTIVINASFYFSETTYTAALTYMSGTTLGFGLDDIRKSADMEKIIVSVFNQVGYTT